MGLKSFGMLLPCGIDVFSGVEFVCCPRTNSRNNSPNAIETRDEKDAGRQDDYYVDEEDTYFEDELKDEAEDEDDDYVKEEYVETSTEAVPTTVIPTTTTTEKTTTTTTSTAAVERIPLDPFIGQTGPAREQMEFIQGSFTEQRGCYETK